jgi:exodeoxyribonuclease V alpha subunit
MSLASIELCALDLAFAGFLQQVQPSANPHHTELAALVSAHFGRGHVCLALNLLSADLQQAAHNLPWTQNQGDAVNSPLVLDGARLYLRRNWSAEQRIRSSITQRLTQPMLASEHLAERLQQLFASNAEALDWQKVACAVAARQHFTLITGGPGTGKTSTVVRLLALLQADPARATNPLRMALAAPTGKAAARLAESIGLAIAKLPVELQQNLPNQAFTLHKLLQVRSSVAHDPLPELALDVLVVDEASMIDLDMMARLLSAVPLHARLILLGDKDQLESVQAGAVLGQLCANADQPHYSPSTLAWITQVTGQDLSAWAGAGSALAQQTVLLRQSHRFAADSAIGQWAQAVNQGDTARVSQLWQQTPAWQAESAAPVNRLLLTQLYAVALRALVSQGWRDFLQGLQAAQASPCSDAQAFTALQAFSRFQVLCAVREGPWGVLTFNQRIASSLGFAERGWYAGRPVMLVRNDYSLGLMNGDIGLCLQHTLGLRVAFADVQGGVRWVLPARLDAVESAYAMTVHKSQGSEFEHVALVLPDVAVLGRELVYTGITRAKHQLTLLVPHLAALSHAVTCQELRRGGLTDF